jgi:hypothetical protein
MPDPTPKPVETIKGHRTKEELSLRKKGEAALATGKQMTEDPAVKASPVAHKAYGRLRALYKAIGKNDALIGNVINRYCLMLAECDNFQREDERLRRRMDELEDNRGNMDFQKYLSAALDLEKCIQRNDAALQQKRKMLFDIEKENLMTLQGQIRSIQKKPPADDEEDTGGMMGWKKGRDV